MNALAITEGFAQGLPHRDAHILVGVVIIDMGISHCIDLQINQPMAADLMKHVIQKGNTGAGLATTRAIKA